MAVLLATVCVSSSQGRWLEEVAASQRRCCGAFSHKQGGYDLGSLTEAAFVEVRGVIRGFGPHVDRFGARACAHRLHEAGRGVHRAGATDGDEDGTGGEGSGDPS